MARSERIRKVAERLAESARAGKRLAVIVSAMADTTDELIGIMHEINPEPDPRELDQLMATGEIVSCSLTVAALQGLGIRARSFNAFNLGIRTKGEFGGSEIRDFEQLPRLAEFLKPGSVAVIAGFQGINPDGDLTTLGRGGSDITAVAVARDLGQKVCEKFTDESGVFSADPRLVPTARKIWHLSYDEMETLARNGNGILHPRSIVYARDADIRIHVRSSFTQEEGSVIGPLGDDSIPVKSITLDRKQAFVQVDFPRGDRKARALECAGAFPLFSSEWRSVNRGGSLRISFRKDETFRILSDCWQLGADFDADDVTFNSRVVALTLVGTGFSRHPELAGNFFAKLEKKHHDLFVKEHQGIRVTIVVAEDRLPEVMRILHDSLVETGRGKR